MGEGQNLFCGGGGGGDDNGGGGGSGGGDGGDEGSILSAFFSKSHNKIEALDYFKEIYAE